MSNACPLMYERLFYVHVREPERILNVAARQVCAPDPQVVDALHAAGWSALAFVLTLLTLNSCLYYGH